MDLVSREAEIKTDRARVDIVKFCVGTRSYVSLSVKQFPGVGYPRMDMSSVILHSLIGPRLVLLPC